MLSIRTVTAVFALIMVVVALPVVAQRQQIGPVEVTGFSEVNLTKDTATLSGPRVYVRTTDGKLEAKAQKIVIRFGPQGPQSSVGSLKTATLTGDVWMLSKPEPNRSTEARSARAEIDWAGARQAVLSGGVDIKSADPTAFAGPLTLTADKATVSLKRDNELKPDEVRIRVESDPDKSKLEFTPLPPKESEQQ